MYDDEEVRETEPHSALDVIVDGEPDERGNVLAFALLTHQRRIALTFNCN